MPVALHAAPFSVLCLVCVLASSPVRNVSDPALYVISVPRMLPSSPAPNVSDIVFYSTSALPTLFASTTTPRDTAAVWQETEELYVDTTATFAPPASTTVRARTPVPTRSTPVPASNALLQVAAAAGDTFYTQQPVYYHSNTRAMRARDYCALLALLGCAVLCCVHRSTP
jgi:hypothetical protein